MLSLHRRIPSIPSAPIVVKQHQRVLGVCGKPEVSSHSRRRSLKFLEIGEFRAEYTEVMAGRHKVVGDQIEISSLPSRNLKRESRIILIMQQLRTMHESSQNMYVCICI